MRLTGHVACMEEKRSVYRVLVGKNLKDIYSLEVLGRDGRIILKWI